MYRQISLVAAALTMAVPVAAAQSWNFTSNANPSATSDRCGGGLACSRYGLAREWLAPHSGNYKVTIAGGEGGAGWETQNGASIRVAGGAGAIMSGVYTLSAGTQLVIIAGQAGASSLPKSLYAFGTAGSLAGGGGGGGSFIFSVPQLILLGEENRHKWFDLSSSTILAAAGGGGGTTSFTQNFVSTTGSLLDFYGIGVGGPGLAGRDGGMTWRNELANSFMGGINGDQAGRTWIPDLGIGEYINSCSNSGASYRVTALNDCTYFNNAQSIDFGFAGGFVNEGVAGGYGGGGSGNRSTGPSQLFNSTGGGGGGGYSGGGGGAGNMTRIYGSGGGGGSYISDDAVFVSGLSGANRGNGYVTIELIAGVPEPASWAMLIAGFGLVGAVARRKNAAIAV